MIKYTITSGSPTKAEVHALESALAHRKKTEAVADVDNIKMNLKSQWAKPRLRTPLARKN